MNNLYKISICKTSKGLIKDLLECDTIVCYDIASLQNDFSNEFEKAIEEVSSYGDIENMELAENVSFNIENKHFKITVKVISYVSVYDIDPKGQLQDLFDCVGIYTE